MPDIRLLTLDDLWLPGDVLGGAMLRGWSGPATVRRCNEWDEAVWLGLAFSAFVPRGTECAGFSPGTNVRLDCTRPEVRDRAVRVLGADLLPIHAAELRGEITPGEAAGLVWCSVVRREAGLGVVKQILSEYTTPEWADADYFTRRIPRGRLVCIVDGDGWFLQPPRDFYGCEEQPHGVQTLDAGRAAADAAAIAAGYSLREPGGMLLLPLPDGVVGRLDTNA